MIKTIKIIYLFNLQILSECKAPKRKSDIRFIYKKLLEIDLKPSVGVAVFFTVFTISQILVIENWFCLEDCVEDISKKLYRKYHVPRTNPAIFQPFLRWGTYPFKIYFVVELKYLKNFSPNILACQ